VTVASHDAAYSSSAADGLRFGAWRRVTASGKAGRVLRALRRLPETGVSALDVGCGDGALLVELGQRRPGWAFAGVEISPAAARIAAVRLPGVRVETYDGDRLPWPDGAFDVGVLSHVLEHVADPPATLREVARVCRLVVVEVPLERNLSAARRSKRAQADEIGHLWRFSRHDLRELIRAAGLSRGEETTATLSRDALRFFAGSARARRAADAKWLVQRALHRCAPAPARHLFTLQYTVVCEPRR
jgi:SAM-dependent methyltransferase